MCDVFKAEDITRTVARTVEALGGIDILVNNAYDGAFGPLLSLDDDAFMRGIHAGPLASFRFMRACHPHLKARGGGNIVNLITSAAVRWDSSNYGAYAVAKQGVRALTRAAASEWGPDKIRVNNIAPLAASPALANWIKHDPEAKTFFQTVALEAGRGLRGGHWPRRGGAGEPGDGLPHRRHAAAGRRPGLFRVATHGPAPEPQSAGSFASYSRYSLVAMTSMRSKSMNLAQLSIMSFWCRW